MASTECHCLMALTYPPQQVGELVGIPLTIPAEMKRIESEPLWQILHTDRKEENVEAVRLRNQILKYVCSEQPMTLKWPPSVSVRTASFICVIPCHFSVITKWLHAHGFKVTGSYVESRKNLHQN